MANTELKPAGHMDNDVHKGATEGPGDSTKNSLQGQLAHREKDPLIKQNDSDFPEPGGNPEHSGQEQVNPEAADQTDEPGFSQKTNQNWRKDDPLAA